jgi:hypothetical protein
LSLIHECLHVYRSRTRVPKSECDEASHHTIKPKVWWVSDWKAFPTPPLMSATQRPTWSVSACVLAIRRRDSSPSAGGFVEILKQGHRIEMCWPSDFAIGISELQRVAFDADGLVQVYVLEYDGRQRCISLVLLGTFEGHLVCRLFAHGGEEREAVDRRFCERCDTTSLARQAAVVRLGTFIGCRRCLTRAAAAFWSTAAAATTNHNIRHHSSSLCMMCCSLTGMRSWRQVIVTTWCQANFRHHHHHRPNIDEPLLDCVCGRRLRVDINVLYLQAPVALQRLASAYCVCF